MLIDLLSPSNQISFNIKLAEKIGLHPAIYISEVLSIDEKAQRKNKLVENDYVLLDRNYIESRTTLSITEQYSIDEKLLLCKIIKINADNKDMIQLDINQLASIASSTDESEIAAIAKNMKTVKRSKQTKEEGNLIALMNRLKPCIAEVHEKYEQWLRAVILRYGCQSTVIIDQAQNLLQGKDNKFIIDVLNCAAINQWRDIGWAINSVNKSNTPQYSYGKSFVISQATKNINVATDTSQLSTKTF